MTFADLAANDDIFLDANTLVYHFASHQVFGPAANQLMTRIESQQLEGPLPPPWGPSHRGEPRIGSITMYHL